MPVLRRSAGGLGRNGLCNYLLGAAQPWIVAESEGGVPPSRASRVVIGVNKMGRKP